MKLFFRLGRAALASFFLLFIVQIFSSCNCPKHGQKGQNVVMYGCIATEYRDHHVRNR